MNRRPALAFACAHMTDERLYAHQVAALAATHDCQVFVFREHDSMAGMAEQLLAAMPERFTLIGLSLGGYAAFEVIRRALTRLQRLVLIDTTAVADHPARREGRRKGHRHRAARRRRGADPRTACRAGCCRRTRATRRWSS